MRRLIHPSVLVITALFILAGTLHSSGAGTASEGCLNQWMFNGVWRVQVTKVEPFMDGSQQVGWQVTELWRNGTSQEIAPSDSVLKDQALELEDGSSIAASSTSTGTLSMNAVGFHSFAPAAQYTQVQVFRSAAALNPSLKAKALTITFDGDKLAQLKSKPQFTTRQYNYHIKLDCTANGAQAAQGGSFEIKGASGCMNQWMSNGLWRVRATAVGPNNNDVSGPQNGWTITEDWTNLSPQSLAPGDTNVTDQQLVLASGNTISSSAGVISGGSFGQMATHTFAPGGSFTYQQRFIQLPFPASDKPVRLIVTFDATKQKLSTHRPQYKTIPPNFRIDLTCSK